MIETQIWGAVKVLIKGRLSTADIDSGKYSALEKAVEITITTEGHDTIRLNLMSYGSEKVIEIVDERDPRVFTPKLEPETEVAK